MWHLADSLTPDGWPQWVTSTGMVGLLTFGIAAFVRGWIVPSWVLKAKDEEIAAKDAELTEARLFIRDQMMPLLTRTQDVLAKTLEEQAWAERRRRNE